MSLPKAGIFFSQLQLEKISEYLFENTILKFTYLSNFCKNFSKKGKLTGSLYDNFRISHFWEELFISQLC